MTGTYTVGYDGSPPSRQAVMWAAAEAELTGATVDVVGCYALATAVSPWMPVVPYDVDTVRAATDDDIRAMIDVARLAHPAARFTAHTVAGSARTQLVAEAADSALLVVGSTGAGAAESWLLGSVAYAAARTSPCPVVIVPGTDPGPRRGTIVVGTDGSEAANHALVWATDEADRRNAELVVVHAWDYPYGTELSSPTVHDLTRVDAALVLDDAVRRCRERGRGPVRGELVQDRPSKAILDHADRADLVVVGSRGRGGFKSLLFGSVAHTVVEHTPCPVVVVRPVASAASPS
jgi:nucleotide-binding universal stress UspA family protein